MASRKSKEDRPQDTDIDRRQRRSEDRDEALALQLEFIKNRLGLAALVLCDDLGDVVASTGAVDPVQELAIQTPWLMAMPEWELQSGLAFLWHSFPDLKRHNIALRPVSVPQDVDDTLFLAGVGDSSYLDAWMDHAVEGVKRIFRTTVVN